MKKPCPACNAPIEMGLLVSNSHIYRCPKFDSNKLWNILIFTGAMLIWFYIRNLKIVKKDFVIRNKDTKQIAYIDKKEWNEILKNSMGKENNFEITETL
jgi:CRISPR/Cas system CSM-associated protein Csm4 (group 5 of RAMP superfamily)